MDLCDENQEATDGQYLRILQHSIRIYFALAGTLYMEDYVSPTLQTSLIYMGKLAKRLPKTKEGCEIQRLFGGIVMDAVEPAIKIRQLADFQMYVLEQLVGSESPNFQTTITTYYRPFTLGITTYLRLLTRFAYTISSMTEASYGTCGPTFDSADELEYSFPFQGVVYSHAMIAGLFVEPTVQAHNLPLLSEENPSNWDFVTDMEAVKCFFNKLAFVFNTPNNSEVI